MPWSDRTTHRPKRRVWAAPDPAPVAPRSRSRALLLIDQRPLQRAAWAEFHAARKRHEKVDRDLQRHEEADTPSFQSWLAQTFPQHVTALRDLQQDLAQKAAAVQAVEFQAAMSGRSRKKLWAEYKAYQADPEAFERAARAEEEAEAKARAEAEARNPGRSGRRHPADEIDDAFDDFFKGLFGDDPDDSDDFAQHDRRSASAGDDFFHDAARPAQKPENADAKDIYRRLVSHLHPDRGGEWTPARERVWHEVQEAWAARDADWLARLEVSWETANDTVGPDSSLGRLRLAIAELDAARRDTERKLRHYRKTQAWRFTLSEKKRPQLHRQVQAEFLHDLEFMRRQLDHLNRTIAAWETPL
ncbi:MAG: hypothetical protein RIQ79_2273, partial [Verrucomicrobiota bacterium]